MQLAVSSSFCAAQRYVVNWEWEKSILKVKIVKV